MNRITELDSIRPQLEEWVESTASGMGSSAIALSLFTDNYKKSIDSLLQFAIAIMLDKPIFLLAPNGTKIPKHVESIAHRIEFFDPKDKASFNAATQRLLDRAREQSFVA